MLRKIALFCALAGCWIQAAGAAPIGWYGLDLKWRDGSFAGKMFYDPGSPFQVLEIDGVLTDTAQVTPIRQVWNLTHAALPDPWLAFNNAQGSDPDDYNAAFYLHLLDLGSSLAIDGSMDNSLYDWSHDAFYSLDQLDQSPLLSWAIAPAAAAVPEPSGLGLVFAGLAAAVAARRRRPAVR